MLVLTKHYLVLLYETHNSTKLRCLCIIPDGVDEEDVEENVGNVGPSAVEGVTPIVAGVPAAAPVVPEGSRY